MERPSRSRSTSTARWFGCSSVSAVFRVAARIVGPHEADDVSQDAFVRAYHRLSAWRREGRFRAWLLQITHNVALNAIARRRPAPAGDEPPEARTEAEARGPVATLESKERRERLESKHEDIATVTSAPLGSVKGRLHRARSELIDLLRRNAYDWELPDGP